LLGFSLTKILFTIVVIFAVLWVYRQFNRLTEGDSTSQRKSGKSGKSGKSSHAEAATPPPPDVEDLSACPACGAYVAAGSNPGCGRAAKDCPMHR
jgi:hypothetical protein